MPDNCQEDDCDRPATQRVIIRIEIGQPSQYRHDAVEFCTEHAADIADEIALGEPPNVAVVSIVALTSTQHDGSAQ